VLYFVTVLGSECVVVHVSGRAAGRLLISRRLLSLESEFLLLHCCWGAGQGSSQSQLLSFSLLSTFFFPLFAGGPTVVNRR